MNSSRTTLSRLAVAALMALGVSAVSAQTGEINTPNQDRKPPARSESVTTRGELRAEAIAATRAGSASNGQLTARQKKGPAQARASTTSRAAVKSDAKAAKAAGQMPNGELGAKDRPMGASAVAKP